MQFRWSLQNSKWYVSLNLWNIEIWSNQISGDTCSSASKKWHEMASNPLSTGLLERKIDHIHYIWCWKKKNRILHDHLGNTELLCAAHMCCMDSQCVIWSILLRYTHCGCAANMEEKQMFMFWPGNSNGAVCTTRRMTTHSAVHLHYHSLDRLSDRSPSHYFIANRLTNNSFVTHTHTRAHTKSTRTEAQTAQPTT